MLHYIIINYLLFFLVVRDHLNRKIRGKPKKKHKYYKMRNIQNIRKHSRRSQQTVWDGFYIFIYIYFSIHVVRANKIIKKTETPKFDQKTQRAKRKRKEEVLCFVKDQRQDIIHEKNITEQQIKQGKTGK